MQRARSTHLDRCKVLVGYDVNPISLISVFYTASNALASKQILSQDGSKISTISTHTALTTIPPFVFRLQTASAVCLAQVKSARPSDPSQHALPLHTQSPPLRRQILESRFQQHGTLLLFVAGTKTPRPASSAHPRMILPTLHAV